MPTTPRLIEMGMVPAVARETVNQFNAVIAPSANRFIEHGVAPVLANELATQATGPRNATRLVECGLPADLAREVVT